MATPTQSSSEAKTIDTLIADLPREKGWIDDNKSYMYLYNGFWHSTWAIHGLLALQQHFKPHPNDVLLASYPKSGTTWLKALLFSIVNRATYNHDDIMHPLLNSNPHDLDVLVSLWHFIRKLTPKDLSPISLQEAFHRFSRGVSPFGPYWDHAAAYYKASVQFPDRVFFVRYEDLKTDSVVHVKKLAAFLGQPFSEEEENEGAVQKIIDLCSFEKLSNLKVNKDGLQHVITMSEEIVIRHSTCFRRGEVGDWKTHLTQEMKEVLDQITEEKFKELGLKPFQHPDKTTA
nr:flavonol sulfotransferase-like [Ipomoea trifida]